MLVATFQERAYEPENAAPLVKVDKRFLRFTTSKYVISQRENEFHIQEL